MVAADFRLSCSESTLGGKMLSQGVLERRIDSQCRKSSVMHACRGSRRKASQGSVHRRGMHVQPACGNAIPDVSCWVMASEEKQGVTFVETTGTIAQDLQGLCHPGWLVQAFLLLKDASAGWLGHVQAQ